MPKEARVVHPSGWLQKLFTYFLLFFSRGSSGSSGSLGTALLEADLRPDRPYVGELLNPRCLNKGGDELLPLLLHPSRCPHRCTGCIPAGVAPSPPALDEEAAWTV